MLLWYVTLRHSFGGRSLGLKHIEHGDISPALNMMCDPGPDKAGGGVLSDFDLAREGRPNRRPSTRDNSRSWHWIHSKNGPSKVRCHSATDTMPSLSPGTSSASASVRGKMREVESAPSTPTPYYRGSKLLSLRDHARLKRTSREISPP